jgi:hypothetical protein
VKTKGFVAAVQRSWNRTGDWLLAACCFLLALALYLQTLAPAVPTLFDDSLEFPLVAHRLAIAHPTGYPLYTLLAALFARGPWSNVAWGVNLFSAVAAAVAVALVYLVARRLVRRRLAALLGAAVLALSPIFWSQAVVAEVYALHAAFVGGLLWLALRWAERPLLPVRLFARLLVPSRRKGPLFLAREGLWLRLPAGTRRMGRRLHSAYRHFFPAVPPRRRLRPHPRLYALAALSGLSLTHHRTIVLLAPALLVYLLLVERRALSRAALLGPEHPNRPLWLQRAGRPVVILALSLLVPLLLYLYLPLRGHIGSLDAAYRHTWSGFWGWVTARDYGVFLGDNPLARDLDAAFYAQLFWQQFGPVGLALALVGLAGLWRQPKALALTGLAFLAFLAFGIVYRVPDVEVFLIPAFLIAAVWIAAGLDRAANLLRPRGESLALRRLLAVCLVLVLLAGVLQPLFIAGRNFPDLDLSRRWIVHDYGRYLLEQELAYEGTIVGILGEVNLLRYLQETTGRRPDLETAAADLEPARRAAVDAALARGSAVYLTRPLPGLTDDYALDAVVGIIDVGGPLETLMRVGQPSTEIPELPRPVDRELVPGLELLGYGLHEHRGHWQGWARLRLWWRAPDGLAEPYKISARLLDAAGQQVAAADAEPVAGAYPTTAWRPGEVVADAYEIPLPAGLPPGDYVPLVIVYDPATGAERGRAQLDRVYLQGNAARPPRRALEAGLARTVYARFGQIELLGHTPPDPAGAYAAGDALPLTLLWQAGETPEGAWQLEVLLEGQGHSLILTGAPVGGRLAPRAWAPDQVVRQWLTLQLPGDLPPGDSPASAYHLKLRVLRDGRPVPWSRGLLPLGSDLELGTYNLVGR